MLRRWTPFALLGLFAISLSACTSLNDVYNGRYPYPDSRRAPNRGPVYGRTGDYRTTAEYRRLRSDADRYASLLDRELHLNGRQENAIEAVLRQRTEDLLRRTNPRDHYRVYPFPRDERMSGSAKSWWDRTDRDIERVLDRRQRDEYRTIARDLERYGTYDSRRYSDRGRDNRGNDRGPAFCRSGAGHPVYGRRWCTDRGYYSDRDYDRDHRGHDDWDDD